MDPVLMLWLLRQAGKLIAVPIGKAAWDEFLSGIGQQIGGAGADFAGDWLRRAVATPKRGDSGVVDRQLAAEIGQRPEAAQALGVELGRQLGVELETVEPSGTMGKSGSADDAMLAAYLAIFWRFAVLAFVEERPIAAGAGLQGAGWVTVCVPQHGLSIGSPTPPTPNDVFRSSGDFPMLSRPERDWGRADFFVRRLADDQVGAEVQALNRGFRRSRDADFPPDGQDEPFETCWHRINGLAAVWVQLQPDQQARRWMTYNGKYRDIMDMDAPPWEFYPPEWHPLIDIPDEVAGATALDRSIDDIAADSAALQDRIAALAGGASAVLTGRAD
jgi:hypothetical protein